MITKEDILEKLKNPILGATYRYILKLALKGLESEDLICGHRIVVNNLNYEIDGLNRSRDFWRKKYESLTDELDDKIIAIEDKLRDTVTRQYHDAIVVSAARQLASLRDERDAFHRLVGEMQTENHCKRADLENVCKERDDLKDEIEKWKEAHCAKNADIDKLFTENEELARLERELRVVLGEWAAVEVYLHKSPKLTIGDKVTVACLRLLKERDEIEKWKEAYCARNALIDKLFTENEELKIKIEKFQAFFD